MAAKPYVIDVKRKKCITPECRGSYVSILEKRQLPESEKMAYGMQCMFPKNDVVDQFVKDLKQIYVQVLLDKFGAQKAQEIAKVISAKQRFPVRDGDDDKEAGLANAEQLKGHYFINTNNQFKQPYVLGPTGKVVPVDMLTPDDIYSGAWYRVMLEFWYYDVAGNKGISTSIAGLMKTKDDDNLGAGTSASEFESALGEFSTEAVSMFDTSEPGEPSGDGQDTEDETDQFNFL